MLPAPQVSRARPYVPILTQGAIRIAAQGTGTFWFADGKSATASGVGVAGGQPNLLKIGTASAEWPGMSVFNLLVSLTTTVTQTGVTLVFGLYPVTISGTTSTVLTLGTVVAGSTVTFTAPAAATENVGTSGDFVIPAADMYVIGLNQSAGTTAASSQTPAHCILRGR